MRKTMFVLSIVQMTGFVDIAHQFWLEPDRFYLKTGENVTVNFRAGEDFIGEQWKVDRGRIVRLEHHSASQVYDLQKLLKENTTESFMVQLEGEGTHAMLMQSDETLLSASGGKFTEYLVEEGLDDILYQRKNDGSSADSASQLYSIHAKLLLQAGHHTDDHYKRTFDLPIEIIPDKNPAALKKGDAIAFKILFQGKPVFGAKVKVWNRYNHRISVQNIFSQQNGMIETHVSNPGAWMVSVVRMVPMKTGKTQYRSYWGTLVFGVRG